MKMHHGYAVKVVEQVDQDVAKKTDLSHMTELSYVIVIIIINKFVCDLIRNYKIFGSHYRKIISMTIFSKSFLIC